MKDDRLQSWKDQPPETPKEKATAELLQSLRSAPTLSPEALARVGRRVRADAQTPESRWVSVLTGLRLPAVAGALGSVAIVGGLTYVALERRPVVELPGADQVAPASPGPLELAEPAAAPAPQPPPPPVEMKRARPERLAKDERSSAEPARRAQQSQPLPEIASGSGARGLARSGAADRAEPETIAPSRAKASDSLGSSRGAGAPEPAFLEQKMAARPSSEMAGQGGGARGAPSANALAGAPPAAPSAPSVAAEEDFAEAPTAKKGERPPAAPSDDNALVNSAEQLAATGRCVDAIVPFSIVADTRGDSPLVERALFGRARCRLTLHEDESARQDLETYLARFPNGRFARQARMILHQP